MSMKHPWLGFGAIAVALALSDGRAFAQQAGVTSAVNPTVQGTPPGLQPEVLRLGSNIARNEHITTSPEGLTQILFNDGTNLSIGPNAELTIDEYVYQPNQSTGRIALSLAHGVLQLTGGRIANDSPTTIETPTGTIGIRGAVGLVSATPDGATTAAMVYGKELTVRGRTGAPQTVTQSNFAITVERPGAPASPPTYLTRQLLASLSTPLTPASGSTGGTSSPPTEQTVQQSGSGLTKVVTTPATGGLSLPSATSATLTTLLSSIAQSVSQTQAISQEVAQLATTPLSASALLNDLLGLFAGSSSGSISVLFSRVYGVNTSATGTVNGQTITISAIGQNFSGLLGQQTGTVNVTINGTTLPFTISTTAPSLRQIDSFPSSTQTLTATLFGTSFKLVVNNSLLSIRNANVATGTINGVPFSISLPNRNGPVTFTLAGVQIYSGSIVHLKLGFKP